MLAFENIQFLWVLFLLFPLFIMVLYHLRWKQKVLKALGKKELVLSQLSFYSPKLYLFKIILLLGAIAFAILAVSNLRRTDKNQGSLVAGVDVVFALDVSNSMLGNDMLPSRLACSKVFIQQLIEKLENNRFGLVLFAGQAFIQMPLTTDIAAASMFLQNASPQLIPEQGTDLAAALQTCNTALGTKETKHKVVILITDGEDHGRNVLESAEILKMNGVVVHTIGVGSEDGSKILDESTGKYKTDESGSHIISKLNQKILNEIAKTTGGHYLHLNKQSGIDDLVKSIKNMEKKSYLDVTKQTYYSFYPVFLTIASVLLVAQLLIKPIKR